MRTSLVLIPLFFAVLAANADVVRCTDANGKISYTDGKCPTDTRQSRQVAIDDSPPPPVPAPRPQAEESRQPAYTPPPPVAAPSGPAIIPRHPIAEAPPVDPPVYILGPEPYYDGPQRHAQRPPRVRDPGPPPGQRPCQNLAGIKRNNC
ncbi:hypothetical protein J2W32_005073 [Variovorax boronicumulans]|uniref:DUF4124 domain-containing protein n=1 Tax=Variovorax boronicumulans TaxID=436515 RepID=A0AAW8D5B1_9BURK|nr:DUF4124 domain-containing protein [Variovorax boronicumulans]MDP9895973.1 hypothetical protein [Variovorax boronicumulans]MDQ0056013.1 hypothetical protein [Variovorax boronicumulans]